MEGTAPKISFVVPMYNMEPFVSDCLASILGQGSAHDYEIIVIDDASTDASVDVVGKFNDSRIHIYHHRENVGAAGTITEGLSRARGKYIARIDPDDRYRPCFLDRTVEVLETNPDVGLVFGRIAMIDAKGVVTDSGLGYSAPTGGAKADRLFDLLRRNYLPAPTVLARREAWALGLPIPQKFKFNDWYLSLSIAEQWLTYFIDDVLADYRIHSNNMHSAMVRDGWAEPIIMEVLERFLGSSGRHEERERYRNEIFATQFRQLADQYFGFDLLADARRCYWEAIRRRPDQHVRPDVLRRLMGTYIGRQRYERLRSMVSKR